MDFEILAWWIGCCNPQQLLWKEPQLERESVCVFYLTKGGSLEEALISTHQSQSADMGVFYPWRKKRTSIQVGPFFTGKELTEWISNQLVILSNYAIHFFLNKSPLPQFSSTTSWAELSSALEWVSRAQFMTYWVGFFFVPEIPVLS